MLLAEFGEVTSLRYQNHSSAQILALGDQNTILLSPNPSDLDHISELTPMDPSIGKSQPYLIEG